MNYRDAGLSDKEYETIKEMLMCMGYANAMLASTCATPINS